jgi:hypothetical protein
MSGSASRCRRRFGLAARVTGFEATQPLSTASENTLDGNDMTLRTVFGARPWASIPPAESLDVVPSDRRDRAVAERRRDVHALHRLEVPAVRRLHALDVKAVPECSSRVVYGRRAREGWNPGLTRAQAERELRRLIDADEGQPVDLATGASLADPAIDATPVEPPPAPVVGAVLQVQVARSPRPLHNDV